MKSLWQDVRYGMRIIIKNPGYAGAVLLSLSLGLGINIIIFSVLNSLLLRPLPGVQEPGQLLSVYGSRRGAGYYEISYPDFLDFREQCRSFSGLTAHTGHAMVVSSGNREPQQVGGAVVSGNFFDVLGVKPAAGRFFLPEDDRTPNASPVVVVGHGLWKSYFNSDPSLVGSSIKINGHSFNVVGIAPPEFRGVVTGLASDVWVPVMMHEWAIPGSEIQSREASWLMVIGRLKPGATEAQAGADVGRVAAQLEAAYPASNKERGARLAQASGVHPEIRPTVTLFLVFLMGVAIIVLLIAAFNVASLQLARAVSRRKEIAVRLTLGAGRFRLVRQLLTESILLALISGLLMLVVARWVTNLLLAFKPAEIPFALDLGQDIRVYAFAFLLALVVGALFGLAPALQATKLDLVSSIKDDDTSKGFRRSRLRSLLIVVQVALSMMLLAMAGLFVKSVYKAATLSPGFDASNVYVLPLNPSLLGYDEFKIRSFFTNLMTRTAALPDVQAVTLSRFIPLGAAADRVPVVFDNKEPPVGQQAPAYFYNLVSPGYFEALGIPVVRGRGFSEQDREGSPNVVVVNEAMARQLSAGEQGDVLGRHLRVRGQDFEVVGVAKEIKYRSLVEPPRPYLYFPVLQSKAGQFPVTEMQLQVRARGEGSNVAHTVMRETQALDPDIPLFRMRTMKEAMESSMMPTQLSGTILGVSGAVALLLSVVGVYGLISYSVTRRTREIGVRMALGARRRDVVRMIVFEGMRLTLLGLTLGFIGAFLMTRVVSSFLMGVSPADPLTYLIVTLLLVSMTFLACYFPARRAVKITPMQALRED